MLRHGILYLHIQNAGAKILQVRHYLVIQVIFYIIYVEEIQVMDHLQQRTYVFV